MRTLNTFSSPIIKLPLKDIDTDQIIPADFLKTTSKEGLGQFVFYNLRKQDPHFPKFDGARILVAGKNFGCGSSREHAPWALKDAGVDVLIASEFADIFRGNAEKNGLLLITLPEEEVQHFFSLSQLTVDLERQEVVEGDGSVHSFSISHFSKKKLLEGLSDLDYLLGFLSEIRLFAKAQA